MDKYTDEEMVDEMKEMDAEMKAWEDYDKWQEEMLSKKEDTMEHELKRRLRLTNRCYAQEEYHLLKGGVSIAVVTLEQRLNWVAWSKQGWTLDQWVKTILQAGDC